MIRCGNKLNGLGQHEHATVAQVKACYGGRPVLESVPSTPAHEPRKDNAVDNAPCGCNGYHGDGSHCYTCGRRLANGERLVPSSQLYSEVPAGRYALMIDNKLRFFKVDKPTKGRWVGYTFMRELFGAPGNFGEDPIRSASLRADYLKRIELAGVPESAALFGQKLGHCGRCMSPLTDVRSRAAGYGETCARHEGWPYPTEEEAREALHEYQAFIDGTAEDGPRFSHGPDYSVNHV